MRYYPAFIDLEKRPCLVIGGGLVAERKAVSLVRSGADVTIISPGFTKGLIRLSKDGCVRLIKKGYAKGGLLGFFLAIVATNSKKTNLAVANEAKAMGMLVNVVDSPELSTFIVPSTIDRKDLVIAISTSGRSPLLSRAIRLKLENEFGAEYEMFVEILGAVRENLLKNKAKHVIKKSILQALVDSEMPSFIKEGNKAGIDSILKDALGPGHTLKKLGINIKTGAKT